MISAMAVKTRIFHPTGRFFFWLGLLALAIGCASLDKHDPDVHDEANMPKVLPAALWKGELPSGSFKTHTPTRITLVHSSATFSAGDDPRSFMKNAQQRDMERGWGDLGAHYYIDPNGVIYQSRRIFIQGHVEGFDSEGHVLIVPIGNYNTIDPMDEDMKQFRQNLVQLIAWLIQHHEISRDTVRTLSAYVDRETEGELLERWLYSPVFDVALREAMQLQVPDHEKKAAKNMLDMYREEYQR